jgi:prolyl-tRNA editing enzyme YbaK/EbsC (Cys-tRNA(Pro) deacylase)
MESILAHHCHRGGYIKGVSLWVAKTNGGVPPFGHSTQLRVFVDPDLLQYDEVWAAAGTWNDNFGAAPADIVRVAGGVVTELKRDEK